MPQTDKNKTQYNGLKNYRNMITINENNPFTCMSLSKEKRRT